MNVKDSSNRRSVNIKDNRKTKIVSRKSTSKSNSNSKGDVKRRTTQSVRDDSVASKLNERHKEKVEKERFLKWRMWFSTILSKFFMDRGTIPYNIGNNVLVTNNIYITKLTGYIQIFHQIL